MVPKFPRKIGGKRLFGTERLIKRIWCIHLPQRHPQGPVLAPPPPPPKKKKINLPQEFPYVLFLTFVNLLSSVVAESGTSGPHSSYRMQMCRSRGDLGGPDTWVDLQDPLLNSTRRQKQTCHNPELTHLDLYRILDE